MTETDLYILIISGLLIFDLLTVATRAAFLHPNLVRVIHQHETMEARAVSTIRLAGLLPKVKASLNLILIIDRLMIGACVILWFYRLKEDYGLVALFGFVILAGVILFVLSWTIESIVNSSPELWAIRLTPFAQLSLWIMTPLTALPVSWSGKHFAPPENTSSFLADELRTLVDAGEQEGVLEEAEGKMISSIFDMGNTLVRAIMVPRIDMLAIDVTTPIIAAVDTFRETGHSRLPVYEETVDNIIGLLYAKDLLRVWSENNDVLSMRDLLRPVHFVPEAKRVNDLLAEMQARRIHLSMVVDEYGGIAGLVTLEDIVEEILGEIQDEYDQAEELIFQQIDENEYLFQGRVDLDEVNEILASRIPKIDADTLGGFIYSQIGKVPVGGEVVQIDDLTLTVEEVSGRRIKLVRVKKGLPENVEDVKKTNVNG